MLQRRARHQRSWQRGVARGLLVVQAVTIVALVAFLAMAPRVSAAGGQTEITSAGPLTRIIITGDLNCQVAHQADQSFEFFPGSDALGACGTFLAFGGTLYGPESVPAGTTGATPWTPGGQTPVSGSGSGSDPFEIVTSVSAGDSGVRIEQTDSYVIGEESYRTDVRIINDGGGEQQVVLFRAADCFLQDSDTGFGRVDNGAPACVISQASDARIEQWVPISPGSHYVEGGFASVWDLVAQQESFPDTCLCDQAVDNGAGLSWGTTVAAGASATISHLTFFSPEGRRAETTIRASVPGPDQISLDPVVVASSVVLAAGIVFVVPFPAALFNSTLEQNYAEVSGWWKRLGVRVGRGVNRSAAWAGTKVSSARRGAAHPGAVGPGENAAGAEGLAAAAPSDSGTGTPPAGAEQPSFWRTPVGFATFIGLSALLYSLLDPTFGISLDSLGTFIGLALGLLLTLAAYGIPLFVLSRGKGFRLTAQALPGTLFIAIICVLVSRIANFQPGYLYGLIIGFGFTRELTRVEEGRLVGIATATALAAAIVAWLALPSVRSNSGVGIGGIVLETALVTVVVAGLEGSLFGMMPLRFLPGERVRAWNQRFWIGLIGVSAFAFLHILLNPSSGYLANTERSSLFTVIGLLVVFGIGSVLFWGYFRFIRRTPGAGPPTTPATPPPTSPTDQPPAVG